MSEGIIGKCQIADLPTSAPPGDLAVTGETASSCSWIDGEKVSYLLGDQMRTGESSAATKTPKDKHRIG